MIPNPFSVRASLSFFVCLLVAATAAAGTLTGTVRAAATQQPLPSKVIAAYDTTGTLRASATTDPTGNYVMSLPAGSYRVLAYDLAGVYATMFDANAESFETTPLMTIGSNDTVRRDFALVIGGTITGTVLASSGAMVGGAVIEAYNLSGTRRGFTTADSQGHYSIVLPPGEYKLIAYDPSGEFAFSFHSSVRTFAEAARVGVTASQAMTIDFRLERAGRITGRIFDIATGLPLAGVDVYAYTQNGVIVTAVKTNANGQYQFLLPAGSYRFAAGDPARKFAPGFLGDTRSFETSRVIGFVEGNTVANLDIGLLRGATIAGKVRDASGAPLANVTVAAYNLDGTLHTSVTTNAAGEYELLVQPGTYKLVVFDAQLVYATTFLNGAGDFLSSGVLGVATAQALRGFDFTLVRGGRITGTVRDGSQPRANITVAAYDITGVLIASAMTTADGTYALVVPPGDYRFVAFDSGFRYAPAYDRGAASFDETLPRTIATGASVVADFALRRGVTVTADVVDANGTLVSGVNVFAIDAAGHRISGGTSVNGKVSLTVPAGTWRFVAIDSTGRYSVEYYQDGALVRVVEGDLAPSLRFTLEQQMRRRGVRH